MQETGACKVPANGAVRINADGYIMPYTAAQQRTFVDPKNYLSAIPTTQILLYPPAIQADMQNPGWQLFALKNR